MSVDVEAVLDVRSAGRLDALVTHFEAALSPHVRLSTDPALRRPSSWLHAVRWVPPADVSVGELLQVAYRYRSVEPHGLSLTARSRPS